LGTSTRGRSRTAAQDFLFHLQATSESAPALKTIRTQLAAARSAVMGGLTRKVLGLQYLSGSDLKVIDVDNISKKTPT